jgi:hypothetical protein
MTLFRQPLKSSARVNRSIRKGNTRKGNGKGDILLFGLTPACESHAAQRCALLGAAQCER